jgi:hypothetical protein
VLQKREEVKARRIEIAGEAAGGGQPRTIEANVEEPGAASRRRAAGR